MDGFTLGQIRLALRIENHFINLSILHEARIAINLAGRPISLERKIKEVGEENEKEYAS
jgi:hypothetical protein